jgi:membrane associated rhomboid family serine protease
MRWLSRRDNVLVEVPHALTLVLVLLNVAVYALCFRQSGNGLIAADVLLRNGAMYSQAIPRGEYWRLIAYGFVHADGIHLTGNMICLMFWGGHLEKRIGHLYFLLIYLAALVAGALISDVSQSHEYLTVGASGATSGLLGALLFLGLFGKVSLSASFFVVNIGVNVALAAVNSRINWAAHLGGFAAGLIGCALLDAIERANGYVLRCKFPEFVKLNGFVIVCAFALFLLRAKSPVPFSSGAGAPAVIALVIASVTGIKLVDLLLSIRWGLAATVVLLALANAALVAMWASAYPSALARVCAIPASSLQNLLTRACSYPTAMIASLAGATAIITLLACRPSLVRGLTDVGFVGNSLRAERQRRSGL